MLAVFALVLLAVPATRADELQSPLDPAPFEKLAVFAERRSLPAEAQETREWIKADDPLKLSVAVVPSQALYDPPETEEFPTPDETDWRKRFDELRGERAKAFLDHAKRAITEGNRALASQLLHRALRENPQQQDARERLGYEQDEDRWLTDFERARLRQKEIWHPKFGWVPRAHVGRLENGERYYQQQWITADVEQKRRARIDRGWNIATEHFTIWTNTSLEGGGELAYRLEQFHQIWRQIFFEFAAPPNELTAQSPRASTDSPRKFRVNFYRDRAEYLAALKKYEPNIGVSDGYYSPRAKASWFAVPADYDWSTLYHETTHQLFQESRRADRDAGMDGNAWALEGIACYMESLEIENGLATIGGTDSTRFENAKTLLLDDKFQLPLAELTRMGRLDIQNHPRIRDLYTQSAGLAQFFMHAEQGALRKPFLEYLADIYAGRHNANTLARGAGKTYPELDAAYRRYVEQAK